MKSVKMCIKIPLTDYTSIKIKMYPSSLGNCNLKGLFKKCIGINVDKSTVGGKMLFLYVAHIFLEI